MLQTNFIRRLRNCAFSAVLLSTALSAGAATRLPFSSNFETGDFSEWDGGQVGELSVTSSDAAAGRFAAQGRISSGRIANQYMDFIFGDHARVGGTGVTAPSGLWLQFDSKFDSDFTFGRSANLHKIAIINFEDENSRRRYQVLINVWTGSREYYLEHLKWNADRSFNRALPGLEQNIGTPVQARLGQWDRLLVFLRPNTPGRADGEVRFWVNGVLKAEYRDITLREDTTYSPNKLIMGNYVTDTTTSGVQRWDNFYLGENDPRANVRPLPPQNLTAD
jgi:hypothetical protein